MIAQPISAAGPLVTNGFEVVLPETVEVLVRDFPNGAEVKAERERVSDHWFVHWFKGMLYYFRLKGGGVNVSGRTVTLRTREHPWLLRSCLEDSVAEVFHKYEPLRRRPFTFLAQKQDLVATAAKDAGIDPSLPRWLSCQAVLSHTPQDLRTRGRMRPRRHFRYYQHALRY